MMSSAIWADCVEEEDHPKLPAYVDSALEKPGEQVSQWAGQGAVYLCNLITGEAEAGESLAWTVAPCLKKPQIKQNQKSNPNKTTPPKENTTSPFKQKMKDLVM